MIVKIKGDINRMKKILSVPFFITTYNKKTEMHDWINLVNILYAILRYYVIRNRFLSQKVPTELAVPPTSHILCAVWEDPTILLPTVTPAHCVTFTSLSDAQIQVARSLWRKSLAVRATYFCVIGREFALQHHSGVKNF